MLDGADRFAIDRQQHVADSVPRELAQSATAKKTGSIKPILWQTKNRGKLKVPDPYYGLGQGFDRVLDMVEDAARGLITILKEDFPIRK